MTDLENKDIKRWIAYLNRQNNVNKIVHNYIFKDLNDINNKLNTQSNQNKSIFINCKQFESSGPGIGVFSGLFNGYFYEFLELKNIKNGISICRSYFSPPSNWTKQLYNIDIYYLTADDGTGSITLSFGLQNLTMNSDVTSGNEFQGNSSGGFQFGSSTEYRLTIAPNTSSSTWKRPLQRYRITQNIDFTGITFASINVGRYMNQNQSQTDTYNNSVYIIGVKITQI